MKKAISNGLVRMENNMFKFDENIKSHMPFTAPDPQNGFRPRLFCCIMIGGKWKIHQFKNGTWVRINTGLPEDATECSPAAECIDGVWHLTFIAGGSEGNRQFRLYHICDLDAGVLPVILCPADAGFLQKNTLVHASRHGPVIIEKPGKVLKVAFNDAEYLYRIDFDPFCPSRLYISGQTFSGEIFSLIYLTGKNELYSLEADGVPAYKAAFWKEQCFYAQRNGTGFEDRRIVKAERIRRTRLNEKELVTVEIESARQLSQNNDEEFE